MKHDFRGVKNSDIIGTINEYVHSDRDRKILISRFVDGKTICELSDKYGLSEEAIKKIIRKHEYVLLKVPIF